MTEELKTRGKLKLFKIAKEWLRTEHQEGNAQSLVNLILSFIEPREKCIEELEKQIEKMKRCEICKHYRWNHCSYEIHISEDCIQNKLKHFELKE